MVLISNAALRHPILGVQHQGISMAENFSDAEQSISLDCALGCAVRNSEILNAIIRIGGRLMEALECTSLAGQPYFSLFPVGGEIFLSLSLLPPENYKEKYGWLARLRVHAHPPLTVVRPLARHMFYGIISLGFRCGRLLFKCSVDVCSVAMSQTSCSVVAEVQV